MKFILGVIVGIFISMMSFSLITVFNISLDMSIITNAVIAIATVTATVIHFDSQKKQRIDRIWDINKGVLLDLAHSLSDAIEATEIEINNRYSYHDEQVETKPYIWKNLDDKVSYVLNVYSSLMSTDLIASIKHHNKTDKEVTRQVNYENLDTESAYETMLVEHKELYSKLLVFIGDISGVNNK